MRPSVFEAIEEQSKKFIEDIKNDRSIFLEIPKEIGELIYCNTTDIEGKTSKEDDLRQSWLPMANWEFSLNGFDDFIYEKFTNIDFFIGTEGLALVRFKGKRESILGKIVILYRDITDIVLNVTEHRENGEYKFTEYEYAFCSIDDNGNLSIPYGNKYSFDKRQNKMDEFLLDFNFAQITEKIWSELRFKKFLEQNDDVFHANEIKLGDFPTYESRVVLTRDYLNANGVEFEGKELEKLSVSNGWVNFFGQIQKTAFFGFIKKRKKASVYVPTLSNKQVFTKILEMNFR